MIIGFGLGHDLDFEFLRLNVGFAVSAKNNLIAMKQKANIWIELKCDH